MERVARNKQAKALQGQVVGGHHVGYGYRYVHDKEGKPIGYEVDEPTMRHVRRIFEDIAAGDGIRTVKEWLDGEYIPTPRTRATSGACERIADGPDRFSRI
jgi:hypothetical protein